jgi:hypothetical protein
LRCEEGTKGKKRAKVDEEDEPRRATSEKPPHRGTGLSVLDNKVGDPSIRKIFVEEESGEGRLTRQVQKVRILAIHAAGQGEQI